MSPQPQPAGPSSGSPPPDVVVEARVGEPVALPLPSPGATGYSWRLVLPDGVVEVGSTDPVAPPAGAELGASSGVLPLVVAADPGTYDVTARLARPWDDRAVKTRVLRLVVGAVDAHHEEAQSEDAHHEDGVSG